MDLTRDKYREAEFFLEKMRETVDEEEFRFHLSAFVSAARSTTSVFQKGYRDSEVFGEWYGKMRGGHNPSPPEPGTVQAYMRDEPLFTFMNSLRNSVLKEGLPLTTATMLTETDISPTSIELIAKMGFPEPQVILETNGGDILGATIGYAWKIREREEGISLLAIDQDGNWRVVMALSDIEYNVSELRCRYRFDYQIEEPEDLNEIFFLGGEEPIPQSLKESNGPPTDANIVITELCIRYLQEIDGILAKWEQYIDDEIEEEVLLEWEGGT